MEIKDIFDKQLVLSTPEGEIEEGEFVSLLSGDAKIIFCGYRKDGAGRNSRLEIKAPLIKNSNTLVSEGKEYTFTMK